MKLRIFLVFCALNLALSDSKADSILSCIADTMEATEHADGLFQQSQYIRVLKKPLVSNGRFLFSPSGALQWNVEYPLTSELLVDPTGQIFLNGKSQARKHPIVLYFAKLMSALIGGDFSKLSTEFSISGECSDHVWQLTLEPKSNILVKIFEKITVWGSVRVSKIALLQTDGDRVVLEFTDRQNEPNVE